MEGSNHTTRVNRVNMTYVHATLARTHMTHVHTYIHHQKVQLLPSTFGLVSITLQKPCRSNKKTQV